MRHREKDEQLGCCEQWRWLIMWRRCIVYCDWLIETLTTNFIGWFDWSRTFQLEAWEKEERREWSGHFRFRHLTTVVVFRCLSQSWVTRSLRYFLNDKRKEKNYLHFLFYFVVRSASRRRLAMLNGIWQAYDQKRFSRDHPTLIIIIIIHIYYYIILVNFWNFKIAKCDLKEIWLLFRAC